jgi:cofilin
MRLTDLFFQDAGVTIAPDILGYFNEMKLHKAYRGIIFKMSDDNKQIVIDQIMNAGEAGSSYDDFLKAFPEDKCRYGLFDFIYDNDGSRCQKICFFLWAPTKASIRDHMVYAASKDSLRKSLSGIPLDIQATEASDMAYEEVIGALKNKRR